MAIVLLIERRVLIASSMRDGMAISDAHVAAIAARDAIRCDVSDVADDGTCADAAWFVGDTNRCGVANVVDASIVRGVRSSFGAPSRGVARCTGDRCCACATGYAAAVVSIAGSLTIAVAIGGSS